MKQITTFDVIMSLSSEEMESVISGKAIVQILPNGQITTSPVKAKKKKLHTKEEKKNV